MVDKVVHRFPRDDSKGASVYPKSAGVKIDSELLAQVEAFIKKKENKYMYVNRKQFIDVAVLEYLKKMVKK